MFTAVCRPLYPLNLDLSLSLSCPVREARLGLLAVMGVSRPIYHLFILIDTILIVQTM